MNFSIICSIFITCKEHYRLRLLSNEEQRKLHLVFGEKDPDLRYAKKSTGAGATLDEALRSDVVLSVPQMLARTPFLGDDVTVRQIPGGVHDLALSPEPARSEYLDAVTDWLRAHLG